MNFHHSLRTLVFGLFLATTLATIGCDNAPGRGDSPVATTPTESGVANVPILKPFEGRWKVDEEKTFTLWKSQGRSQKEIDETRDSLKKSGYTLHADLVIEGNVVVMAGTGKLKGLDGELLLFAMHADGPWVCGKAWHHEDRHDPGDMNKCYARLQIKDGQLLLATRDQLRQWNTSDPDLDKIAPAGGSAETCDADKADAKEWSPWSTCVFVAEK